ncbi:hypothetical protein ACWGQ4_02960 [Streptomyces sp. NPDC055721]|uniref:hypothetical protein n=1 Tax=Streptomyces sp. NPDC127132 TaxID=3345374 RepID=UPI0036359BCB
MKIQGVDLRSKEKIVYQLLDEPTRWRVRAVERIEFSSSLWMERTRVLHVPPLREVLGGAVPDQYGSAWVRLPIGAFPRVLLFGFEVTVAGREVYRIPARAGGLLMANYVVEQAEKLTEMIVKHNGMAGDLQLALLDKKLIEYLVAISVFEAGVWHRNRNAHGDDALVRYLQSGLPRRPGWAVRRGVNTWKEQLKPVLPIFGHERSLLGTDSPAENPLLVLPSLESNAAFADGIAGLADIRQSLGKLIEFLKIVQSWEMSETAHPETRKAARNVLQTYKSIGQRWIAFADSLVPLDDPFTVSVTEWRAIELTKRDRSAKGVLPILSMKREDLSPTVSFHDAHANHVSLRITDPNIQFGTPGRSQVKGGGGRPLKSDMVREKGDLLLVYSSDNNRPSVATIECVVQPTLPIRMIHWVVGGIVLITFLALIGGCIRYSGELTAPHVALLLTPSTFASALLLSRESSSLSSALAKPLRVTIATLLAALWLFAICEYLADNIHLTETVAPSPSRQSSSPAPG